MSVAEEIEKLDALRKQGLVTDAEFEQRKQQLFASEKPKAKRSFFKSWWFRIPIALLGLWIGIGGMLHSTKTLADKANHRSTISSGKIAACDSGDARDAIENAFRNNAGRANLQLLDMQNIQEAAYVAEANTRLCNALITTNAGQQIRGYILSFSSQGRLLVEVREPITREDLVMLKFMQDEARQRR